MRKRPAKIIFGAGVGYSRPPVIDNSYKIYCVRGPLSADKLKINKMHAISDSAYLVLRTSINDIPIKSNDKKISIVPHYLSMNMLDWETITSNLSMNLIDPAGDSKKIINEIRSSSLVLCESLHGAILADAFRIPWIPIRYSYRFLDFKWYDWALSVGVNLDIQKLPSVFSGKVKQTKKVWNSIRVMLSFLKHNENWSRRPFRTSSDKEIQMMVKCLDNLSKSDGFLSHDSALNRIMSRFDNIVERLMIEYNIS